MRIKKNKGESSFIKTLVGSNPGIKHVCRMIEKVSISDANVLILGESGTGKEVVARNIHYNSLRKK